MPRLDGITVIAMVLVASFAIDRIVTGILFLLSFNGRWARRFPDPDMVSDPAERVRARNTQKLLYYCFGGVLAVVVLGWYGKVRVLAALGFPTNALIDVVLTGLILVGGSDRVAEFLKMPGARGGAERSEPKPITIQGTLVLEEKPRQQAAPDDRGDPRMFA